MDHKRQAKQLLVHYFSVMAREAGIRWDGDNVAEIEDIVDHIIAAAAQAAADKLDGDRMLK